MSPPDTCPYVLAPDAARPWPGCAASAAPVTGHRNCSVYLLQIILQCSRRVGDGYGRSMLPKRPQCQTLELDTLAV